MMTQALPGSPERKKAGQPAGPDMSIALDAEPKSSGFNRSYFIDPELREIVPRLLPISQAVPTDETLSEFRKGALIHSLPALPEPAWSRRSIPGPTDAPDLDILIINANPDKQPRPMILYLHGGGYVMGSAYTSLRAAQELAAAVDCVVASVEYRLAPETRFPGALEDNYAALKWVFSHAEELGGDPTRIAVVGESAGGGHAATLAIAARDRGQVPLAYQALIYPMLDDRTGSTQQLPEHLGALIWTPAHNRYGWSALLGVSAGATSVPVGAVPARHEDLRSLAPAFIGVGSIDLFVDENVEYARRLIDCGVSTQLEVVPGAFHGFDGIPGTKIGARFKETLYVALRSALANSQ